MTQVDQVSGLLTDLYIGGTAIPAAAGAEVSYAAEFFLPRGRARRHGAALPGAQLVR